MTVNYRITKLQVRILRWIVRKLVIQSHEHQRNITEYYRILVDAAREEFREDNRATLDHFLKECHDTALEENWEKYKKSWE